MMESFKQGLWKGYHLSMKGIRKGVPFLLKMVDEMVKG